MANMAERFMNHLPERQPRPKITLRSGVELDDLENALDDFARGFGNPDFLLQYPPGPRTADTKPLRLLQSSHEGGIYDIEKINLNNVAVSIIDYDPLSDTWNDPYFDAIFRGTHMESRARQQFLKRANPADPDHPQVMMIKLTKAGPKFIKRVQEHADAFHHGSISLGEVQMVLQARSRNEPDSSPITLERQSLEQMLAATHESIKFYALQANKHKGFSPGVMKDINRLSDHFEPGYEVAMAVQAITKDRNKLGEKMLTFGTAILGGFEGSLEVFNWGNQEFAEFISQVFGEGAAMVTSKADRYSKVQEEQQERTKAIDKALRILGIMGQSVRHPGLTTEHAAQFMASYINTYKQAEKAEGFIRAGTIGLTVATAWILSHLSQDQNNLAYYAGIPFTNTTILNTEEIFYERATHYKGMTISDEEYQYILDNMQPQTRFLFTNILPHVLPTASEDYKRRAAQAFHEFGLNKYGQGAWLGAFAASLSVPLMESFNIPHAVIYTSAGVVAENLIAYIYAKHQLRKKIEPEIPVTHLKVTAVTPTS